MATTRFEIGLMGLDDVADCSDVFSRSVDGLRLGQGLTVPTRPRVATRSRIAYLQQHDADASWVARSGGAVAGFAQAALREEIWVLVHLFVAPEHQSQGVGTALLERAHAYGLGVPFGIISSSADPSAIGRYARLPGFRTYPALRCFGEVRRSDGALRSTARFYCPASAFDGISSESARNEPNQDKGFPQ